MAAKLQNYIEFAKREPQKKPAEAFARQALVSLSL